VVNSDCGNFIIYREIFFLKGVYQNIKMSKQQNNTAQVATRLTQDEKERLVEYCQKQGIPPSILFRKILK
jgi:hypothetical protein